MRKAFLSIILLCLLVSVTYADDDLEDLLLALLDNALNVNIVARITENGEKTVWNMDISRVTISGRSVQVKLNIGNTIVLATITPYETQKDDSPSILLVIQGQTLIKSAEDDEIKVQNTFESIPVKLGEPIFFFPLGVNLDVETDDFRTFNLELEIQIETFEDE
jgi:hypothetical protein